MAHNLINLLPPERVRALNREYYLRLMTVAFVLGVVVLGMSALFLVPSYRALSAIISDKRAELATLSVKTAFTPDFTSLLATAQSRASALTVLATAPTASAAVKSILSVPRPGISLTALSFTPAASGRGGVVSLAGRASTREALRAYDLALSGEPFVTSVDLPISAYANESDISFTMKVTGTFTP